MHVAPHVLYVAHTLPVGTVTPPPTAPVGFNMPSCTLPSSLFIPCSLSFSLLSPVLSPSLLLGHYYAVYLTDGLLPLNSSPIHLNTVSLATSHGSVYNKCVVLLIYPLVNADGLVLHVSYI